MAISLTDLPFPRGKTFFTGVAAGPTIGGIGAPDRMLEGREFTIPDLVYTNGVWVPRSQTVSSNLMVSYREVTLRVVRCKANSGVLLPRTLVSWESTSDSYFQRVAALTTGAAINCVPVDEFLPAAGVLSNDLFYVVVRGPAEILSNGDSTAISVGDAVGSAASGLFIKQDLTSATPATHAAQIATVVGRAMLANANTASVAIPIDVGGYVRGM